MTERDATNPLLELSEVTCDEEVSDKTFWYPHEPALFTLKTAALSLAALGAYARLYDYLFVNDSLPADPRTVARILGTDVNEWLALQEELAHRIVELDGRLYCPEASKQKAECVAQHRKKVDAGRRGGLRAAENRRCAVTSNTSSTTAES